MMGLYSQVPVFDREIAVGRGLVLPRPHFRDAKQMYLGPSLRFPVVWGHGQSLESCSGGFWNWEVDDFSVINCQ